MATGGDTRFTFSGDASELNKTFDKITRNMKQVGDHAVDQAARVEASLGNATAVARKSSNTASTSTEGLAKRLKSLQDTAGDTDSTFKGLAGAIGVFSPAAELALMRTGDLIGGVEALFRGTGLLGKGLGLVVTALAAVAVAAAAAGTAFLIWRNRQEAALEEAGRLNSRMKEATARVKEATAGVRELGDMWAAFGGVARDAQEAYDLITGAVDAFDVAQRKGIATAKEAAHTALLAQGQLVASMRAKIAADEAALLAEDLSHEQKIEIVRAREANAAALAREEEALNSQKTALADTIGIIEKTARLEREAALARDQSTKSSKAAGKAAALLAKQLEPVNDVMDALLFMISDRALEEGLDGLLPADAVPASVIKRLRDLEAVTNDLAPVVLDTAAEALRLEIHLKRLRIEAKAGGPAAAALADDIQRLEDALASLGEDDEGGDEGPGFVARMANGFRAVGGAISGVVGMTDRMLSAVAGVSFSDLLDIAASGDIGLLDEAMNGAMAFVSGVADNLHIVIGALLDQLPEVVAGLQVAIVKLIDNVLGGPLIGQLVAVVPPLIGALVGSIIDALPAIVDALASGLGPLVEGLMQQIGPLLTKLTAMLPDLIPQLVGVLMDVLLAVLLNLDQIIVPLVRMMPVLAQALTEAIFTEVLPRLPEILGAVAVALMALVQGLLANLLDAMGFSKAADSVAGAQLDTAHVGAMLDDLRSFGSNVHDEIAVLGRSGEAMLSPQGVQAAGGRDGVNQLNAGEPSTTARPVGGGGLSRGDFYRAFDQFVRAQQRQGTGALSTSQASGHRARRG